MRLGGILTVADGLKYDYCMVEALHSLIDVCDEVAVTTFCPEDTEELRTLQRRLEAWNDVNLVEMPYAEWDAHGGMERYAYWKNETLKRLHTDWYISVEADEVIHESSHGAIREAIETSEEGFFITRLNLWGDAEHYFVPELLRAAGVHEPVGQEIVRLARTTYTSSGDAQGIDCLMASRAFENRIVLFHMGFVRDPVVMAAKSKRMGQIYGWGDDPRVGERFNPWAFFSREVVRPIPMRLPKHVEKWASERREAWQY